MARDYSKPGNTPPGTTHTRPKREIAKTWHDFIGPADGYAPKDPPKEPTTVPFTRPVVTRQKEWSRRAAREFFRELGLDIPATELVTRDEPFYDVAEGARLRRRRTQARRDRQQRKGQRAFNRQQLAQDREKDTVAALLAVAQGNTSATPAAVENATLGLQRKMEAIERAK